MIILHNILYFLTILIINPKKLFNIIISGEFTYEIYFIFSLSALITLLKAFFIKTHKINYYSNENLNAIFSFLSLPQLMWILAYISFFMFLYLIIFANKLIYKKAQKRSLFVSIMSISGLGLIAQIFYIVLNIFLPSNILISLSYIIIIWIVLYTVLAIKYSQNIPTVISILLFFFAALLPFFLSGFAGIAPYLLWLNV